MAANTRLVVTVIVGVVLALVSVLADWLGVGAHPDFGWKQIVGTALGMALAGVGLWGLRAGR